MSREAWGDPPDRQEPPQRCPVCDGEWHAEDCELGQEVARRLDAEREAGRLRAALTLAANRMDVLALEYEYGTTRRNIADDWAKETRASLSTHP